VAAQDGTHSAATVQSPLAPVTVAAYGAQDISLASVLSQLPAALPFASVRIQYSGAPGSLQAQVSSVESGGNLVVDSHVQNEGNGWAGSGANPWHLDNDTETILFLTNESNQPARIGFKVTANDLSTPAKGGVPYYLTKLRLNPHETRAIDLRKLRDAQQPDLKKNTVPAAAMDGSVEWIRLDNVAVMGRLMTINRRQGMASNYDCSSCPCPGSYSEAGTDLSPSSFNLAVNGTQSISVTAYFENCNGDGYYEEVGGSFSWSSEPTGVVSVDSNGNVTGVAAGSATVVALSTGTIYVPNGNDCLEEEVPEGGSATVTVADGTPVISSINPHYWLVGATTAGVIISGQHFGTSPVVNFSDPAVTCIQAGASDTQITCNITVGVNASGGTVNVTVTSQGYNGSGFIAFPGGGSQATSASYPANKYAPYAAVVLSTKSQGAAGANLCGAMPGWARNVTMQLQTQNGTPVAVAGITMADQISVGTPNALGVTSAAVYQHNTDVSGDWPDTYVVCSTACPGSTGEADAIQSWTWSGRPLPHSNYVVYKCKSITVDGR